MTICCGLFCTASKILGALQAILHITCIFGVLQPPKCGSSVKKNTGLDFSSALLRAAPPMAAPRARPARPPGPPFRAALGKRRRFATARPFPGKNASFSEQARAKTAFIPSGQTASGERRGPHLGKRPRSKAGAARGGAGRRGKEYWWGEKRRRAVVGRSGAAGETGEPRRGKRGSLRAAG